MSTSTSEEVVTSPPVASTADGNQPVVEGGKELDIVDVVVLTTSAYEALNPADISSYPPYQQNVLHEDEAVVAALQKVGLRARRVAWDNATFDWEKQIKGGVLIRTIWDYFHRYTEFSAWFERVTAAGVTFFNSAETVAWNIDKHYLEDLKDKKVNICPTTFVEKGVLAHQNDIRATDLVQENLGYKDYVVKPCVSGSARETFRVRRGETPEEESEEVKAHIAEVDRVYETLNKGEGFIVQPFQRNIVTEGELSLMLFDGVPTHAVVKKAKSGDFRVQDDFGGSVAQYEASAEEKEFAMKCVMACEEIPLYARVDIFRDNDGQLALAELELIEPELWFRFAPHAADALAVALAGRLNRASEEAEA